jgi:hypothetical protein
MNEERNSFLKAAGGTKGDGDTAAPALNVDTKLEQVTLPPAPGEGLTATTPAPADSGTAKKPDTPAPPRVTHEEAAPPPAAPATRPREVEPPKKKGKKGGDDQ